ncbi:MAG: UDP-N-acetylmuramoyl-tripeptide--D-alanyl-D-alanine ligase [Candidatus Latescibacter sp.]|nr:UDP-N-acetylmuramoyl-tripeptide--D-alanyl-D-alanine ligase [Candidatus Latescibacter sp.]
MKEITIGRLLYGLDIVSSNAPDELLETKLTGVSTDTRTIKAGDVFFGIKGEKYDGGAYAGKAFRSGAVLAVVNEDAPDGIETEYPVVRVHDTIRALGDAAREYRILFRGKVIGVTGTNGKTTVKEMILSVLRSRFRVHGTSGNFNNSIGLPLSLFGLDDTHECAVFEMGMSAPGEIAWLAGIARPDIGVILNVGPAHMEFFRGIEEIAHAKTELLRSLPADGTAVLNADDPHLVAREKDGCCRVVKFGVNCPADFRGENIVVHEDGCASFTVEGNSVRLSAPGYHMVYNALAAWGVGKLMGLKGSTIAGALEKFTAPGMRMEILVKDGVRYINDAYNANPQSMKAAAEVLRSLLRSGEIRMTAVLGDMRELGKMTEEAHREIGKLFGELGIERLCLIGEYARFYRDGAEEAGMDPGKIRVFETVADALPFIKERKAEGNTIFIKGSRALGLERIITEAPRLLESKSRGPRDSDRKA